MESEVGLLIARSPSEVMGQHVYLHGASWGFNVVSLSGEAVYTVYI